MREWILEQGILFYFFCSVGLLGIIATAAANRTYKRLIKEADNMEKSEHRLIKYIKLKYSSYYTIGLKANDERAMVKRYLYRYKIGPASLMTWSKAGLAALAAVILMCLGAMMYGIYQGTSFTEMFSMFGLAAFIATVLGMQYKISAFSEKQDVFCAQMEDNLENFLKNKIEYGHVLQEKKASVHSDGSENDNPDTENQNKSFSDVSDNDKKMYRKDTDGYRKERAQGQAAASAAAFGYGAGKNDNESVYSKAASQLADSFASEEIDAKVVEDILKEFLN